MTKVRPHNTSKQLPFLALSVILVAAQPAGAQVADGGTPNPAVRALEGQVYRGETDGIVVVLSWDRWGRLEFFFKNRRATRAAMMCAQSDVAEIPQRLECEYGRGLQLTRSGSGVDIVLNPVLAKETTAGFSRKPSPPGPSRYSLHRVSAITTAYDPSLFDPGVRYQPNSSSESGRLGGLFGKQRLLPVTREWLERGVQRSGFDPMSLSLSRVNRLRSHIEEKLNSRGDPTWTVASKTERERLLEERLQDELDQAYGRLRRRQERAKAP